MKNEFEYYIADKSNLTGEKMELQYVLDHTIMRCIIGSQAYGTSTPESDQDVAGVMIPGKEFLYGTKRFDQFQTHEPDLTIYSFVKAVSLITDNNPNMMDLLCIPTRCILKMTKYWDKIMANSHLFISKRCKFTYSGYAISQLNRIKTHRKYLLDPPKNKPTREAFKLPENTIIESANLKSLVSVQSCFEYLKPESSELFFNELDGVYADYVIPLFSKHLDPDKRNIALEFLQIGLKSQLNTLRDLGEKKFIKEEFFEQIEREVKYYNAMRDWERFQEWKKSRNRKRAVLEEQFGFDTKHAMHLVRLLIMGKEILNTGKINVDRSNIDADFLMHVRKGQWSFEQIEEFAKYSDDELTALYESSHLQREPKREEIEKICIQIVDDYLINL